MDFYFTNQKIKKVGYSLKLLSPAEYRYFLIELTVILSKMKKLPKDNFNTSECGLIINEIKSNETLLHIFDKLVIIDSYDNISCEVYSETITDEYYYFEY
jgi:hypothetical protein